MTTEPSHAKVLGRAALLALAVLHSSGCGPKKDTDLPPVRQEGAADEILRVGQVWNTRLSTKDILSPPSPINLRESIETSQLTLRPDGGTESYRLEEILELRSGGTVRCTTELQHDVGVRFGRREGIAAVEVVRPALSVQRSCDGLHPEGNLNEPVRRALFILRADQLVAVEPPLEKRTYIPSAL